MIFYANTPFGRKIAGELKDRTYFKSVRRSKHFMEIAGGYGVDENIVKKLEGSCDKIEIYDTESGETWKTKFGTFKEKSFTQDFGFGLQRFLGQKWYEIWKNGQMKQEIEHLKILREQKLI